MKIVRRETMGRSELSTQRAMQVFPKRRPTDGTPSGIDGQLSACRPRNGLRGDPLHGGQQDRDDPQKHGKTTSNSATGGSIAASKRLRDDVSNRHARLLK